MKNTYKLFLVILAACALVLSSCEEKLKEPAPKPELSVKDASLPYKSGSIFVSVRCEGEWTLEIEYPAGEETVKWGSLNAGDGAGDKAVTFTYTANTSESPRSLRLVLVRKSDSETAVCELMQLAFGDDGNNVVIPPVDLMKTDWLELPATPSGNGLEYYSHKFLMNGQVYRNYSFGWSQDDCVSLWVAYPLCKFYTSGNVGRTDAWAYDPLLGSAKSAAPFGGYGGAAYDRGHQLPSGDRQLSREANAQTFYGTNIAPQSGAHNTGIWSALEGKVRIWANTSDTTYVVTGVVVKGGNETSYDSDGKRMTVPVAFYKALLRYHKASTISEWACAGFYTEHKDYGKNTDVKNVSMSIDELEKLTGVDFFANLPAKLGEAKAAALEAQDPKTSKIWF